jgi:hypothetical protein
MPQKTIYIRFGGKRHAVVVEVEHESEDGTRVSGTIAAVTPLPDDDQEEADHG